MVFYFNKARSAKTWISHLNPEDGKSQHPSSSKFWLKGKASWQVFTSNPYHHYGKAHPPLRLGSYRQNIIPLPIPRPQPTKPHSGTSTVTSKLSGAQPLVRSGINYPLFCRDKCLILWLLTLEVDQSTLGWILYRGSWLQLWSPHHALYKCSL